MAIENYVVKIGELEVSNSHPLVLIAGPCVIESESLIFEVAGRLKEITAELGIGFIFKTSFDKANRTSIDSFRGVGLEKGLEILSKVKRELDVLLLTDIHIPSQADVVANVVDIIQIPAFLIRQTDMIVFAARTGKAINLKKGQFIAPWDMKYVVEKAVKSGNRNLLLTERGYMFGYNNLVVDIRSLAIMKELGYPVIYDATHSLQMPGGGKQSGGLRRYIEPLARACVSVGIAGVFMETHPNPEKALSDASVMIRLGDVKRLLERLVEIDRTVKRWEDLGIS